MRSVRMTENDRAARWRRRADRASHHFIFMIAVALKLPLILSLYTLIVFAGFAFVIGIFDSIRASHDIPSVWPQLHSFAAYFPGGLSLAPLVLIVLAYLATRLLDRAVDSLRPR